MAEVNLALVAKSLGDLGDLARLTKSSLRPVQPWQRTLIAHLHDIEVLLQIVRMTIAMERQPAEIIDAASAVELRCAQACRASQGTRADSTTKASLTLMRNLAANVCNELRKYSEGQEAPMDAPAVADRNSEPSSTHADS